MKVYCESSAPRRWTVRKRGREATSSMPVFCTSPGGFTETPFIHGSAKIRAWGLLWKLSAKLMRSLNLAFTDDQSCISDNSITHFPKNGITKLLKCISQLLNLLYNFFHWQNYLNITVIHSVISEKFLPASIQQLSPTQILQQIGCRDRKSVV